MREILFRSSVLLPPYDSSPGKPQSQDRLCKWSQSSAVVLIGHLPDGLSLGRIRVDHIGYGFETKSSHHGKTDFTYHITCVTRHDGGPEDLVGAAFHMHFYKSLFLPVG